MSVGESLALLRQEVWFLFIEFKKCCDTNFSLILCIYANNFTNKTIFSKTYSNFWCTLSRWLTYRNSQLLSQISWLIDAYFRVREVTIPLSWRGDFFNLRKPVFFQDCESERGPLDIIATTAQKMKFSIKDLFSKCDQIRSFVQLMEKFIFLWNTFQLYLWYLLNIYPNLPRNVMVRLLHPMSWHRLSPGFDYFSRSPDLSHTTPGIACRLI